MFAALCAFASLGSCTKEFGGAAPGEGIVFRASADYDNGPETKTAYSGYEYGGKERIDWVNGDRIRIASDKALTPEGARYSDYEVTGVRTGTGSSASISYATVKNVKGAGLRWGSGTHKFYAVYPAPAAVNSSIEQSGNVVTMTLPQSQSQGAQMEYAYMYAAVQTAAEATVNLAFKPMFTAFQFTVRSETDASMTITSFSLSTGQNKAMAGTCRATITADSNSASSTAAFSNFTAYNASTGNNTITVDMGSGITVTPQTYATITVFALPQDYSQLTASFTTSAGETKSLKLQTADGTWVNFSAGHKYNINGLGLPGEWTLDHIELSVSDKTLWVGEEVVVQAKAYNTNGNVVNGGELTWSPSAAGVLSLVSESSDQRTLRLAGEASGSHSLTATFTIRGMTISATCNIHVNEITGLSFDKAYRQYAWPGHTRNLTAIVEHTRYGDIETLLSEHPLAVQWSSGNPSLAVPQESSTVSGDANTLYAQPNDDPVVTREQTVATITATFPAGTHGCNEMYSATTTFRVVPFTAVPGGFVVDAEENEVVFARGNLLVENTFDGTNNNRVWKFEENQWGYHASFDGDDSYSVLGKTKYISHFGFGTSAIAPGLESHLMTEGLDYQWSDWGLHFDEKGVGSESLTDGAWHTLSSGEWKYVTELRKSASVMPQARIYDPASGTSYYGFLFLPEHWETPSGCSVSSSGVNRYSVSNDASSYDGWWIAMEEAGAVFLPAAGRAGDTGFFSTGTRGNYWTSSATANATYALGLGLTNVGVNPQSNYYRHYGYTVRLAHD